MLVFASLFYTMRPPFINSKLESQRKSSFEVALPRTPQISDVAIRTEDRLIEYGPIFSYSMLIYYKKRALELAVANL